MPHMLPTPRAETSHYDPEVVNLGGASRIVLVCEHASPAIPPEFQALGLPQDALTRHIAWDPGALDTARHLSQRLDAPLVHSNASRLLYDCNRPPEAADAIPITSEDTQIPANATFTDAQRAARVDRFYRPFEALLTEVLDARPADTILVTIHSFTPVYRGLARLVEIGILHDDDSRLADALLMLASGYQIQRNAPYGPLDGVTHTLRQHALPRGLENVMLEIRNDLIASPEACAAMAETLAGWLTQALEAPR